MSLVISKKNKLIFFHIPKNAGTSVSNLLLKDENFYYPWVILSKILRKFKKTDNFFFDNFQKKIYLFTSHETVKTIEKKISSEIYDNFFKFAVVRNPYSRFVSRYNYMKLTNTLKELNFPEFLKKHVELSLIADQQYKFLLNKNGKIGVNKIIRFENINEEMTEFSKVNNLKLSKFKKLNISTTENYKDYYDTNTKKIVEDFCKEDLEFFNYSF
tara:strand:- start:2009 stop:2650 length:642 start_codon:yes stop_codon:yes gene_type:complete